MLTGIDQELSVGSNVLGPCVKSSRNLWCSRPFDLNSPDVAAWQTQNQVEFSTGRSAIEERLGTKLDSQHGILVALIDRIRSLDNEIIRQDTLIKTILGVPQLIDSNKIAKADRDDQRKD